MGFTDWIDGRIKVAAEAAVAAAKADLQEAIRTELAALPSQINQLILDNVPAAIRPAVADELNAVLPDLLSGHLLDALRQVLPHFPGFGEPERR